MHNIPLRVKMGSYSVNITMVTWNRRNLTQLCLERLLSTKLHKTVIHIVDNGSTDGTREFLSRLATAHANVKTFFLDKNYGVSVAANFGWSLADSEFYLKIDNDVAIENANWLDDLVNFSHRNKEIGMLGYRLLEKHAITPVYLQSGDLFHEFSACGGGVALIPRHIHTQCGFWNEDYGKYGFEDLDYSNRVRSIGYKVGYLPDEHSVKHLGYDVDVDIEQEALKHYSVNNINKGEKLYLINKFLFENKIRSLHVYRKFLPEQNEKNNDIHFEFNKQYSPIVKIQNELLHKVTYSKDKNDKAYLDLNLLKH